MLSEHSKYKRDLESLTYANKQLKQDNFQLKQELQKTQNELKSEIFLTQKS